MSRKLSSCLQMVIKNIYRLANNRKFVLLKKNPFYKYLFTDEKTLWPVVGVGLTGRYISCVNKEKVVNLIKFFVKAIQNTLGDKGAKN